MKIRWRLRMAAAQREVWTGAELRRLLAERAGLELSSASVSALFTKEPSQIKLSTLIALCTALDCTPNDLFEVDTTPIEQSTTRVRGVVEEPKAVVGIWTGSTVAAACAASGRPRPSHRVRSAARTGSWSRRPGGVCCAPGAARSAAGRSAPVTRLFVGHASAVPSGKQPRRRALAAATAAICVSTPGGAARARVRARARIHRGSAWSADNCAGTRDWACVRGVGSAIPTGRSCAPRT